MPWNSWSFVGMATTATMKKPQPKNKKVWVEIYIFNLPAAPYFNIDLQSMH